MAEGDIYAGLKTEESVLAFINGICGTFFNLDGSVNSEGRQRDRMLSHIWNVSHDVTSLSMDQLAKQCSLDLTSFFYSAECSRTQHWQQSIAEYCLSNKSSAQEQDHGPILPECEVRETLPSADEFLTEYVFRSKPVVIRNSVNSWPAFTKWTNAYFRQKFGTRDVHIKLTPPEGKFEGVEPIENWNVDSFNIPADVRKHLRFGDLVMVRPEGLDMKMSEFLDLIEHRTANSSFMSAYLEYAPVNQHLPGLPFSFAA